MRLRQYEERERIPVVEADGTRRTAIKVQSQTGSTPLRTGKTAYADGSYEWFLDTNEDLSEVDHETFETLDGRTLKRA